MLPSSAKRNKRRCNFEIFALGYDRKFCVLAEVSFGFFRRTLVAVVAFSLLLAFFGSRQIVVGHFWMCAESLKYILIPSLRYSGSRREKSLLTIILCSLLAKFPFASLFCAMDFHLLLTRTGKFLQSLCLYFCSAKEKTESLVPGCYMFVQPFSFSCHRHIKKLHFRMAGEYFQ